VAVQIHHGADAGAGQTHQQVGEVALGVGRDEVLAAFLEFDDQFAVLADAGFLRALGVLGGVDENEPDIGFGALKARRRR
jgi:hypothetical protein